MGRAVHFEIPVDDSQRARTFCADVFGWQIAGLGEQPYWLAKTGEEGQPGIDGALTGRTEVHAHPVVVIDVEDLDATVEAAIDAGASVVHPRSEIPGVGVSAYLRDPEGNTIGVFQAREQ